MSNITHVKFSRKGNRIIKQVIYCPSDAKVSDYKYNVIQLSHQVPYILSYIDTIQREICGSPEYFVSIKIGTYRFFISDYGFNELKKYIQTKPTVTQLQKTAKEYNIRATMSRKKLLQSFLINEWVVKRKKDLQNPDLIPEILEMSESELIGHCKKLTDIRQIF